MIGKARRFPDDVDMARRIYDWSTEHLPEITFGQGIQDGSVYQESEHVFLRKPNQKSYFELDTTMIAPQP